MKTTETKHSKGLFGALVAFIVGIISFVFTSKSKSKSNKKVKNIKKDILTSEKEIDILNKTEKELIDTINNHNIDVDDALDYLDDFVNKNRRL